MTDLYSASSSVGPLYAILWCLYPIAVLVIIELLLGGGFDDDNNDDQDLTYNHFFLLDISIIKIC